MAEYRFSALYFRASLKDESLYIEFSLDIDEDSVSEGNIFVMNKEERRIEPFEVSVSGRTARLKFLHSPAPDVPYTVVVQGGIKAITGEKIEAAVIRTIEFESTVKTSVRIISPANFEKVGEIRIKLSEEGDFPVNSFYIEIAGENAFYSILRSIELTEADEVLVSDLPDGQYYIRARAVKGEDYGAWSSVTTFVVGKTRTEVSEAPLIEDLTEEKKEAEPAGEKSVPTEVFDDELPKEFIISLPKEAAPLPYPLTNEGSGTVALGSVTVTVTRRNL